MNNMESERSIKLKGDLRPKIQALMTLTIADFVQAKRDLSNIEMAQIVALSINQTPPWGSTMAEIAGQLLKEEAGSFLLLRTSKPPSNPE